MNISKSILMTIISCLLFSCTSNKSLSNTEKTKSESKLSQKWQYEELAKIISSEFPEAYVDFMEISFSQVNNSISPETASFLIPTAKMNKLKASELEKRLDNIIKKMGSSAEGACKSYKIGTKETYSWTQWDDKNVTKFYIEFNLGC